MAEIALLNPYFKVSFWGMEHVLPLVGKKANIPATCLALLAALTPDKHRVTIHDENVAPLDFDAICRADIVGLTGMNVQRARMKEIIAELKRRGKFVVVGGPWISVNEGYFGDLADVIFVGEAEESWPRFLDDFSRGEHKRRYEQAERTDMTRVPVPRYDLIDMGAYFFGSVQISRGCPFQCEFCDIIVTFGRRPRLKTSAQVIAEVEALYRRGVRIIFIVDDNLIGNKKGIREPLRELAAWQEAHGYPMSFFTEASLNLAEEPELLELMVEANVVCVFVGVESVNEDSLIETKKLQNVRAKKTALAPQSRPLLERLGTIQSAGVEVWCGMILGFDADGPDTAAGQFEFLQQSKIVHAMVGMLSAIPKTPLYDRLEKEGRLDTSDVPLVGTNVIPKGMSREELQDSYVKLMADLYTPDAYFKRVEDLFLGSRLAFGRARKRYWRAHPLRYVKDQATFLALALGLFARLMTGIDDLALRREYAKRAARMIARRRAPEMLFVFMIKCACHYHYHLMVKQMREGRGPVFNPF